MIDPKLVQTLIDMLDRSSLDSLDVEGEGARIRLSKSPRGGGRPQVARAEPQPVEVEPPPPDLPKQETRERSSDLIDIECPMVGTFYRASAPGAPPYVEAGQVVRPDQVLCIIEAMKLMNELKCETAGRIEEICVEDGEPVDYGRVLFRVAPS